MHIFGCVLHNFVNVGVQTQKQMSVCKHQLFKTRKHIFYKVFGSRPTSITYLVVLD